MLHGCLAGRGFRGCFQGCGEQGVLPMCRVSQTALGPYQRASHTKGDPWCIPSVLCGVRRLWAYSTLIWGLSIRCGQCRVLGDASEGSEAVGIDWGDKGQRLNTQRVSSVLVEQGDGGLLGWEEAGGQLQGLRLGAPGQVLAGLGVDIHFIHNHRLV